MALPQRSGLESLGHKVTVGKIIFLIGKVSTTDSIGFSCQPASSKFVQGKCRSEMQSFGSIQYYIGQIKLFWFGSKSIVDL